MTNYPYILFNQSPEQLRRIGARGGKAQARNRRARLSAQAQARPPILARISHRLNPHPRGASVSPKTGALKPLGITRIVENDRTMLFQSPADRFGWWAEDEKDTRCLAFRSA